ncbi:proline-rich protein 2-like [Pezoporus wallicus]|uniref:proline-rich protein 2-like n=1 Tax=Pezoporus wallicus TaxID=35540 RepID=UPI00254D7259|nr:proline-rich protein 2-like [Pezoporus wallicus]
MQAGARRLCPGAPRMRGEVPRQKQLPTPPAHRCRPLLSPSSALRRAQRSPSARPEPGAWPPPCAAPRDTLPRPGSALTRRGQRPAQRRQRAQAAPCRPPPPLQRLVGRGRAQRRRSPAPKGSEQLAGKTALPLPASWNRETALRKRPTRLWASSSGMKSAGKRCAVPNAAPTPPPREERETLPIARSGSTAEFKDVDPATTTPRLLRPLRMPSPALRRGQRPPAEQRDPTGSRRPQISAEPQPPHQETARAPLGPDAGAAPHPLTAAVEVRHLGEQSAPLSEGKTQRSPRTRRRERSPSPTIR